MSWPALVMWAVVAGIGIPAAFRNRTALALCASWLVSTLTWYLTGENLPILLYFILDYFVLLVIFTKPEKCDCSPYPTFADQVKAIGRERCWSDVLIVGIFPLMWLIYVADIGDFYRWWALWGLVLVQFLVAGWEAFYLSKPAREEAQDQKSPGLLKLGLAGHG